MACRDAYMRRTKIEEQTTEAAVAAISNIPANETPAKVGRLLFGVDSTVRADDLLQNNLTEFEWVIRNKIYPNFWCRNLNGKNAIDKNEAFFLHKKGCRISLFYTAETAMTGEDDGKREANKAAMLAYKLGARKGTAIYLDIGEEQNLTRNFLRGYATAMILCGYTPGFRANTDAAFAFDREYSRGVQTDKEIFKSCLVWATAPTLAEYNKITTTHLIHPDNWKPFAPSGITRNDIAMWQYGKDCHPIQDDEGADTVFNIDLVRNKNVIIDKMF